MAFRRIHDGAKGCKEVSSPLRAKPVRHVAKDRDEANGLLAEVMGGGNRGLVQKGAQVGLDLGTAFLKGSAMGIEVLAGETAGHTPLEITAGGAVGLGYAGALPGPAGACETIARQFDPGLSITAHKCTAMVGNAAQPITGHTPQPDRRQYCSTGRESPWFMVTETRDAIGTTISESAGCHYRDVRTVPAASSDAHETSLGGGARRAARRGAAGGPSYRRRGAWAVPGGHRGPDPDSGKGHRAWSMASLPVLDEVSRGVRRGLVSLGAAAAPGADPHLRMMRQPIEAGRGQQRIAKEVRPFRRRPVTGDQEAAHCRARLDDIVAVGRRGIDQGFEPEVVQDESLWVQIPAQALGPGAIGPAPMEMLEPLMGVDEEPVQARPARFMRPRVGEMAVAHPGGPTEQPVACLADVVAAGQVEHLWPIDAGVEAPIEALQGVRGVQGGPAPAQRQLLGRATLACIREQAREKLDRGPLARAGGQHAREPEPPQLGEHRLVERHEAPPARSPRSSAAVRTNVQAGIGAGVTGHGSASRSWSSMRFSVREVRSPQ